VNLPGDYDTPDVEKIAADIIGGVVPEGRIGNTRIWDYPAMETEIREQGFFDPMDYVFVTVRRRGGYFTDSMTDISGIEFQVWAKDRAVAQTVMNEITKRMLHAEGEDHLGFVVDYVTVLNGPEEQYPPSMDDRCVEKTLEMHIRVRWH
jgi:hypothetical protein